MKSITSYFSREDVVLDLDVSNKEQLFDAVDRHMHRVHGVPRGSVALHLRNRERVGSTGLGYGVAIPHARVKNLCEARLGYFRLRSAIAYALRGEDPVTDVFVLWVPEQRAQEHLDLLAALCRCVANAGFRQHLHACASAADMEALLGAWVP